MIDGKGSHMSSRKKKEWNNNKEDWDCGVQAIYNLQKITGTKKKIDPKKIKITEEEGVSNFLEYRKALKEDPKIKKFKVKANPKPIEIKDWLEKDGPKGETQNVAIIHTKDKNDRYGHISLAYKAEGDKIKIANLIDEEPSSKVNVQKISNKKTKLKRAYFLKVKRKQ